MLYGIGLVLVLVSASFVGGSVIVPVTVAVVGVILMALGKGARHGKQTITERPRS